METIKITRGAKGFRANDCQIQIKEKNGLIIILNSTLGISHSSHPNIEVSGSLSGMIKQGYWNREDEIIEINGFYYNKSLVSICDELDRLTYLMENRLDLKLDKLTNIGDTLIITINGEKVETQLFSNSNEQCEEKYLVHNKEASIRQQGKKVLHSTDGVSIPLIWNNIKGVNMEGTETSLASYKNYLKHVVIELMGFVPGTLFLYDGDSQVDSFELKTESYE